MFQKNYDLIRFGQRLILSVMLIIPICLRIVQKSTGWLGTKSSVLVCVQMYLDFVYRLLYKQG